MLKEKEKKKIVLGWERTYAFGIVRGVDGVRRYGIDEAYLVKPVEPKYFFLVAWIVRIVERRTTREDVELNVLNNAEDESKQPRAQIAAENTN